MGKLSAIADERLAAHYLEGMTCLQIGALFGASATSVQYRLNKAGVALDKSRYAADKTGSVCSKCGCVGDLAKGGGTRNDGSHRKRAQCRKCRNVYMRAWNSLHKSEVKQRNAAYKKKNGGRPYKNSSLKTRYGITLVEYDRMLDEQAGVCAVCFCAETQMGRGGKIKMLAVDHNHKTGKVRALLCAACNKALGLLCEDRGRISSLLKYLEER